MTEPTKDNSDGGSWWVLAAVLSLVCLMIRVQGLRELPIFGDESIYLRWAQLVQEGHWWVSLADPKPPLHFWLLALVMDWANDPLRAGRLLSVWVGVASVPMLMLACGEIGELTRWGWTAGARSKSPPPPSGRVVGLLAAVLMIFSPFVSFYQRLASADGLFLLEMIVVVWLSLRWARLWAEGRKAWGIAVALGVALGAAMMTRQGLSYTLWGVPVVGVVLHGSAGWQGKVWKAGVQLVVAGVIAGVIWSPFLLAELDRFTQDAKVEAAAKGEAANEWTVIKRRILYQEHFTDDKVSRLEVAGRNLRAAFVPAWSDEKDAFERRIPVTGWFYVYMTCPVYFASLLGLVYLGVRGQWRILGFLLGWMVLMLGPPIVLGNVVYSRYVLAGVVPLLVSAGYLLADVLAMLFWVRMTAWVAWVTGGCVAVMALALPMREIGLQTTLWWKQTLTAQDRYQYITGWTGGDSVETTLRWLSGVARDGRLVVVTDQGWGTPADALWVYLSRMRNVELYYTDRAGDGPILRPSGEPQTYLLRKDKWLFTPAEAVKIPDEVEVLYVTNEPPGAELEKRLLRLNPEAQGRAIIPFPNRIDPIGDRVVVFWVHGIGKK